MMKLLQFQSTAGMFYVVRDGEKRYRILFGDTSVGTYDSIADAVESFVNESGFYIMHPEMGYPLDTFDLGIPDDISGWEPC